MSKSMQVVLVVVIIVLVVIVGLLAFRDRGDKTAQVNVDLSRSKAEAPGGSLDPLAQVDAFMQQKSNLHIPATQSNSSLTRSDVPAPLLRYILPGAGNVVYRRVTFTGDTRSGVVILYQLSGAVSDYYNRFIELLEADGAVVTKTFDKNTALIEATTDKFQIQVGLVAIAGGNVQVVIRARGL